jgi:hypothetical protein
MTAETYFAFLGRPNLLPPSAGSMIGFSGCGATRAGVTIRTHFGVENCWERSAFRGRERPRHTGDSGVTSLRIASIYSRLPKPLYQILCRNGGMILIRVAFAVA